MPHTFTTLLGMPLTLIGIEFVDYIWIMSSVLDEASSQYVHIFESNYNFKSQIAPSASIVTAAWKAIQPSRFLREKLWIPQATFVQHVYEFTSICYAVRTLSILQFCELYAWVVVWVLYICWSWMRVVISNKLKNFFLLFFFLVIYLHIIWSTSIAFEFSSGAQWQLDGVHTYVHALQVAIQHGVGPNVALLKHVVRILNVCVFAFLFDWWPIDGRLNPMGMCFYYFNLPNPRFFKQEASETLRCHFCYLNNTEVDLCSFYRLIQSCAFIETL